MRRRQRTPPRTPAIDSWPVAPHDSSALSACSSGWPTGLRVPRWVASDSLFGGCLAGRAGAGHELAGATPGRNSVTPGRLASGRLKDDDRNSSGLLAPPDDRHRKRATTLEEVHHPQSPTVRVVTASTRHAYAVACLCVSFGHRRRVRDRYPAAGRWSGVVLRRKLRYSVHTDLGGHWQFRTGERDGTGRGGD